VNASGKHQLWDPKLILALSDLAAFWIEVVVDPVFHVGVFRMAGVCKPFQEFVTAPSFPAIVRGSTEHPVAVSCATGVIPGGFAWVLRVRPRPFTGLGGFNNTSLPWRP
jgi:hypothetical protein